MCGFAGIISNNQNTLLKINKMSNMIRHRGPDSDGDYSDGIISMSFRRLSIIDFMIWLNQ